MKRVKEWSENELNISGVAVEKIIRFKIKRRGEYLLECELGELEKS